MMVKTLGALAGLVLLAVVAGTIRWNRVTAHDVAELEAHATATDGSFQTSVVDDLPAPAAAYFRAALKIGQPLIRGVMATQEAEFFINGAWRPLTATQHFTTSSPGFVWDARINMAPLLSASVRDAFVNGRGVMQASIFGLYPLANQIDKPELDAGALQRYLGEAVWFPTALLPSAAVSWTPRDERSATVTLRDGSTTVSLTYEFKDDRVVSISGDRYRENNGTYTKQPWHIRCDDHRAFDSVVIPRYCEVSWIVNGRAEPYWRGRISSIAYQYE